MAQAWLRRSRTTLLDQISTMEPTNLRTLLSAGEEADFSASAGRRAVTLASILESEKRGGRRFIDILREEGGSSAARPEAVNEEGQAIRVSLMTLMGLTEGDDAADVTEGGGGGGAVAAEETVCCVCLVRKKGAAFIPCGHTFCRLCSRELRTGRGSCPLCNRPVFDVLDIF